MYDISLILQALSLWKPVIFPTDTVYGLWCDAGNEDAVEYIYDLTDRPEAKGLVVLCDSLAMIEQYADIRFDIEKRMIMYCMPWPLTLVLDSKHELCSMVEQGNGTLAVRIPDHDISLDIISKFWKPIGTKSANLTGMLPPTSVEEIDEYFIEEDIIVIDGWVSDIQIPSTIVRVVDENNFQILRQGSMTEDEIRELID